MLSTTASFVSSGYSEIEARSVYEHDGVTLINYR